MKDPISVLLVDDHAIVRRGFRRLLDDDPGIVVVGEAGEGSEAIALAGSLCPRVIVMDCSMPGVGGIDATRTILERHPDIAVLIVSMHTDAGLAQRAFESGARGYLVKSATDADLAHAIRQIAAGEIVVDPALDRAERGRDVHGLSPRQVEVLQLVCRGLSSLQIAEALRISVHTVGVHRAHIMKTLGVHSTRALVSYALRHRLLTPPDAG